MYTEPGYVYFHFLKKIQLTICLLSESPPANSEKSSKVLAGFFRGRNGSSTLNSSIIKRTDRQSKGDLFVLIKLTKFLECKKNL